MSPSPFTGALALDRPHSSRITLVAVTLAHTGLLGLLLLAPPSPPPVTPPRALMVSLIEVAVEQPEAPPKPAAKPAPPQASARPRPSPPVLTTKRTQPAPVVETPRPEFAPEPVPEVLPPPVSVAETPRPDPVPEPVQEVLPPPAPVAEASEPAPPPSPPSAPRTAAYLANPKPPYPSLSRRLGEQGTVRLNILVNPDGSVARLELETSSGHPRLDRSAMITVQSSWKFEPARQAGKPVAAWVIVPIQFTLRS